MTRDKTQRVYPGWASEAVSDLRRWPTFVTLLVLAVCFAGTAVRGEAGRAKKLVVVGDSLSAGFLLPSSAAFPAVLEEVLRQRGYAVAVTNAASTGDTASGGLARLDSAVPEGTDGVILELGANDKLTGIKTEVTRSALAAIIARLDTRGIPVLLAGIRFSNEADRDTARFNAIFPDLARRCRVVYFPDFYAALAGDSRLKLFDGVHPSPEGVRRIVGAILPTVERFLARLSTAGAARSPAVCA